MPKLHYVAIPVLKDDSVVLVSSPKKIDSTTIFNVLTEVAKTDVITKEAVQMIAIKMGYEADVVDSIIVDFKEVKI